MTISINAIFSRLPKAFVLISLAYVCVNILIAIFMDKTASLRLAADGGSWYLPTLSLLQHGTLTIPDYPELTFYRSPGVPAIFAGLMYLAGGESIFAIVAGQVVLLYATGVIFRFTVSDWFPRYADLGMALILFNPNLLGMAYFVQSETIATFSAMLVLFFLLRYAKGHTNWFIVVVLGLALGATCLVRTNPVYLVYSLPIALVLISRVQKHAISTSLAFGKGVVAMLLALAVISPLTLKIYNTTGYVGWSAVISPRAEFEVVQEEFVHLHAVHNKIGTHDARLAIRGPDGLREKYIRSYGPDWEKLSLSKQYVLLKRHMFAAMFEYPSGVWLSTLGLSVGQFVLGGGTGAWHNLFNVFPSGLVKIYSQTSKTDPLRFILRVAESAPIAALTLSAISLSFVAVTRLLLIGGIVEMCRQRMWGLLLILMTVIAYFALSSLLNGQARYRAPIEPALMLMAVAGASLVWDWLIRRRRNSFNDLPAQ